ncbi:XdhC family protein [Nocardia araoensis]|uniref:XdhC family protein n=1 Tax=Nocardia araoensis TaxID=228600 RepID=UPI0005846F29|nr:XdhC/CoxI family protein [Nocardia araoensis]
MRDVLPQLLSWWHAGEVVGVGTVVATFGSAPLPPGATMIVGPDGTSVGSVSGGCVEGAVYDLASAAVNSRTPVLVRYGISEEDALAVGLTCGGTLDVFVDRVSRQTYPELDTIAADIEVGRAVAVATVIEHPNPARLGRRLVVRPSDGTADRANTGSKGATPARTVSTLGSTRLDGMVRDDVLSILAAGHNATLSYGPNGDRGGEGMRLFVWTCVSRPRLIVFGATDFATALTRVGGLLGYHVTVCDARPVFATKTRFPQADEVVVDWPHRYLRRERDAGRIDPRTVITILTHDPKFDVPVLAEALRLPEVAYIGAMGSRKTNTDRLARLREAGLAASQVSRLHSPIGLDLRGRTPEETAISVAAEFIATRCGGTGRPLRDLTGPIHSLETNRLESPRLHKFHENVEPTL